MLTTLGTELIIILALTLANGFFSGSELAIVSARRSRLEPLAAQGHRGARAALDLAEQPDRFLATVQVGISFIGTFAAAFGGARISDVLTGLFQTVPAIAPYADTLALVAVVVGITYLSLVLGELVPKRLALQHADRMAMLVAPAMRVLAAAARPLVVFLSGSVALVLRLLRQPQAAEQTVTEEDIVYMVHEGTSSGAVEAGEAQFITQIFQFTDRPVRTVMTPRTEIVAIEAQTEWPALLQHLLQHTYSRVPVYQGTLDQVVGVLHVKDVLRAQISSASAPDATLARFLRPPTFVLESQRLSDVLAMFRRQGQHLGLVVDEYGQIAGIVTLEDLLEELVGEIQDEYDTGEELPMVQRADGTWLVDGMEAFDKVVARLGIAPPADLPTEDFTTIAGYVLSQLNRLPRVGDRAPLGGWLIEVVDMDGRRIDKLLLLPDSPRAGR